MTEKIMECVPNFSEGRRPEVIAAIADEVRRIPGVMLLNQHVDADHNRSVLTFAGQPEGVVNAAFAAIAKAAQLIDMDHHQGVHPRLGAADVVPFVPLQGMTMDECVEMARVLGGRVGEQLGLPVYLYQAAATRADRVHLEDVRRGQYETLKTSIESDPNRVPDFGPRKVGTAGAVIIGARKLLVAFNVFLTTDDVSIARKIAAAVRHSSGGLRYLKALGVLVKGRAQVSMNFTDFKQTPLARVVELVRREAERYGVGIHHTELVGMMPVEALAEAAQWYLQLDDFDASRILETRINIAKEIQRLE
ncbi:MAG: glutamate formimidoyltransferase [Anaerolineae bacterium]